MAIRVSQRRVDMNGTQMRWSKGADVASATALTLGTDGNYFDITGTTSITSIGGLTIGTIIKLHFDGALTLTHHATNLILPGGANITTAAGDEAEFVEYATGQWRCTNYTKAANAPGVPSDNAVTGAKIAMGSDAQGDILYNDGTDYARLGAGTSGHFLKTQGAGANPVWAAAGGGTWVLLDTQTASASATLDFTTGIDSTYDQYVFVGTAIIPTADSNFYCRVSTDGGSSYVETGSYDYVQNKVVSFGTSVDNVGASATFINLMDAVKGGDSGGAFILDLFNPSSTGIATLMKSRSVWIDYDGPYLRAGIGAGAYTPTTAVNAIRFYPSAGIITSGVIYLYGVKKT